MVATPRLKNILTLVNLAPGATVDIPHELNNGLRPLAPDIIFIPDGDLVIVSDEIKVSVTNDSSAVVNGDLLVESWHTLEREFGDKANVDLPVKPYIVVMANGLSTAPLGGPIVFRPNDPLGSHGNVYVTWPETYAALQLNTGQGPQILQFDDRYNPSGTSPTGFECFIPAGVYNMDGVHWTNVPKRGQVFVNLGDGASFTQLPGLDNAMQLTGFGLIINSDRVGPIAPFVNTNILVGGNNVKFTNTSPSALPMFEYPTPSPQGNWLILFSGESVGGGIGFGDPLAAPIINVMGNDLFVSGGSGTLGNNAITDTVGFGSVGIALRSNDFVGDLYNEWSFPGLTDAGGVVVPIFATSYNRWLLDPFGFGSPVVGQSGDGDSIAVAGDEVTLTDLAGLFTADMVGKQIVIANATNPANNGTFLITSFISATQITYTNTTPGVAEDPFPGTWAVAYPAAYNELVLVDTSTLDSAVAAPSANPAIGERFTVKDVTGDADGNPITIVAIAPDILEFGTGIINSGGGAKTWASDGKGNWWLVATAL